MSNWHRMRDRLMCLLLTASVAILQIATDKILSVLPNVLKLFMASIVTCACDDVPDTNVVRWCFSTTDGSGREDVGGSDA
eukprot:m.620542 g.620542  ORF g.620542 m.620542 type:complete len:80 (-) comp22536_c0_seq13:2344-2583(-)